MSGQLTHLETPDGLADWLCDRMGIYSDTRCKYVDNDFDHVDNCECRVHVAPYLADRIRQAVKNEVDLAAFEAFRREQ